MPGMCKCGCPGCPCCGCPGCPCCQGGMCPCMMGLLGGLPPPTAPAPPPAALYSPPAIPPAVAPLFSPGCGPPRALVSTPVDLPPPSASLFYRDVIVGGAAPPGVKMRRHRILLFTPPSHNKGKGGELVGEEVEAGKQTMSSYPALADAVDTSAEAMTEMTEDAPDAEELRGESSDATTTMATTTEETSTVEETTSVSAAPPTSTPSLEAVLSAGSRVVPS